MLKTTFLSLGILSSGTNSNMNIVQNDIAIHQAKLNLNHMQVMFTKNHKLNINNLSKNLKVIYQNHKLVNSGGRDGYKHHWYGFDLWISEYTGSKINEFVVEGGATAAELAEILAPIMETGPAAPIVVAFAAVLLIQWEITWNQVDEGNGIHISVEGLTGAPFIVYAHAQ